MSEHDFVNSAGFSSGLQDEHNKNEGALAWSNALIVESRSLYQYTRCAHTLFIYFRGGSVLDDRMLGGGPLHGPAKHACNSTRR